MHYIWRKEIIRALRLTQKKHMPGLCAVSAYAKIASGFLRGPVPANIILGNQKNSAIVNLDLD
jgi:hypothetical protein